MDSEYITLGKAIRGLLKFQGLVIELAQGIGLIKELSVSMSTSLSEDNGFFFKLMRMLLMLMTPISKHYYLKCDWLGAASKSYEDTSC